VNAPGRHAAQPILIAGGGIGGLSAALALARTGIAARVLEAEVEFSESGAGIQIGPNGSHLLRLWGLGEQLDAHCARPAAIHVHDGLSGARLAAIPLGDKAARRYGAPYYVAERRLLHRLLLEKVRAAPQAEIVPSFRVGALQVSGPQVTAMAADGREATGRAMIGADGIHSQIRSRLFGGAPVFSGRNAWRATATPDEGDGGGDWRDIHLWLAPRAHLVHYCCGPNGPLNAVAVVSGEAASPGWGTPGGQTELSERFADWAEAPTRILERFGHWMRWPLMAFAPLPRWTSGPVALLGDAAHPIMPFLASGAVMAIEDAAVLAAELGRSADDLAAAFSRYEQRRMPRVARVQRASARMGDIYHMSGAMRFARNLSLTAMPEQLLLSRNDWLYGYKADDQFGC
jgi:3-hydroxybenzoate 6-monooxygenase